MSAPAVVVEEFVLGLTEYGVHVRRWERRPAGDRHGLQAFDVITQAGDVLELEVAEVPS